MDFFDFNYFLTWDSTTNRAFVYILDLTDSSIPNGNLVGLHIWDGSLTPVFQFFKQKNLVMQPTRVCRISGVDSNCQPIPWQWSPYGIIITLSDFAPLPVTTPLSTYHGEDDFAPCAVQCNTYAGFTKIGDEGFCYRNTGNMTYGGAPGDMLPLYLYYRNETADYVAYPPSYNIDNFEQQTLQCYIWSSTNTIGSMTTLPRLSLEIWHNPTTDDYWSLASVSSKKLALASGYIYQSTVGYLDPSDNGWSDLQTQATISNYAYLVSVEFGP